MIHNREIFKIIPGSIVDYITKNNEMNNVQEIRFRINKPCIIQCKDREHVTDVIISKEEMGAILQKISNYSVYAFEEDIKQGFITFKGGHRIGLCGECVIENRKIKTIKNISSLNIRISREIIGCADGLLPYLIEDGKILNSIIISPPKCGKTTLLRDLARIISSGNKITGKKISLMDERSEIAACASGVPQMNVGIRTDVFDGCIKSEGIMMAIRSMSPEVIICDEIGTLKDVESILMAYNCGVNLICSIHGDSLEDYINRLVFKELIESNIFKRGILLLDRQKPGNITAVYDLSKNKEMWRKSYV